MIGRRSAIVVSAGAVIAVAMLWATMPDPAADGSAGTGRIRCGENVYGAPFLLTLAGRDWFDKDSGTLKRAYKKNTCSAVRIDEGIAVTAKHCLCANKLSKATSLVLGHVTTISDTTPLKLFGAVTDKAIHGGGCGKGGADIAVLTFEDKLPQNTLGPSTYREIGEAVLHAPAYVYGTGVTASNGAGPCTADGAVTVDTDHRLKAARTEITFRASGDEGLLTLIAREGAGGPIKKAGYVCDGDSGAAVIQRTGGRDRLVGIARAGVQRCNKNTAEEVDMEATPATLAEALYP